jgi:hypothetical protein
MTCDTQTKTCTTRGLSVAAKVAALGKGTTPSGGSTFGGEMKP